MDDLNFAQSAEWVPGEQTRVFTFRLAASPREEILLRDCVAEAASLWTRQFSMGVDNAAMRYGPRNTSGPATFECARTGGRSREDILSGHTVPDSAQQVEYEQVFE